MRISDWSSDCALPIYWPESYKIVTVTANPEVSLFQERHGAIIHRRQVMQWLDRTVPETELLETPPARTFIIEEIAGSAIQTALAWHGSAAGRERGWQSV